MDHRLKTRLSTLAANGSSRRSHDIAWATLSRLGGQLIGFAALPVLSRLLGPTAYGVVAIAGVFTGFVGLYADAGVGAALVRRPDLRRDLITTAFYVNLSLGFVMFAILAGLAFPLAAAYGRPSLRLVLIVAGAQMAIGVTMVPTALLERSFRFRTLAIIEICAALVTEGVTIAMAVANFGAVSLVAGPTIAVAAQGPVLWSIVRIAPSGRPTREAFREIWGLSGPLVWINTLWYWSRNIDNLVLGLVAGAAALGVYSRAYMLMMVPVTQVTMVLSRVLLPALTRHNGDIAAMRATYLRALRLGSTLTIPVGIGLACLSAPVTDVMFGSQWHGVVVPMVILAATLPQQVIVVSTGPIYIALGETSMWRRRTTPTYVAMMASLISGAFFGPIGVAVGFAVASYGFAYYAASQPWSLLGIQVIDVFRTLRSELGAAAAMGLAIAGSRQLTLGLAEWEWLLIGVVLGSIVYLAVLMVFDRGVLRQWLAEMSPQRSTV